MFRIFSTMATMFLIGFVTRKIYQSSDWGKMRLDDPQIPTGDQENTSAPLQASLQDITKQRVG